LHFVNFPSLTSKFRTPYNLPGIQILVHFGDAPSVAQGQLKLHSSLSRQLKCLHLPFLAKASAHDFLSVAEGNAPTTFWRWLFRFSWGWEKDFILYYIAKKINVYLYSIYSFLHQNDMGIIFKFRDVAAERSTDYCNVYKGLRNAFLPSYSYVLVVSSGDSVTSERVKRILIKKDKHIWNWHFSYL